MSAFISHLTFEFRTGIRDRTQLLMNYLFPLSLFLMFGFLLIELNPYFAEAIIPAMILIAILSSTILSLPNPLVSAREAGIYRSYKINGVPAISILSIPALTTVLHMVIVSLIITLTAPIIFGAPAPINWPALLLFFLLSAFTHAALGMLISVIASNIRSIVLWSQLIFLPSMLIGGLMLPSTMLPELLGRIGRILPATYAMNLYQGYVQGQATSSDPLWSILILAVGGLIAYGLAIYLFCWDSQNRTRRGHPAYAVLALIPYIIGVIFL